MRKSKLGFTIIEVSLFLAISALLFVGIAAGTSLNVARQRYNNAVEDFTEFLRRFYSSVEDVQNGLDGNRAYRTTCTLQGRTGVNSDDDAGRTECAIYGKIAIFNEADEDDGDEDNHNNAKVMIYDIIGDVVDNDHELPDGINTIESLNAVHAEFLASQSSAANPNRCEIVPAGNYSSYLPDWSSYAENIDGRYWSGAIMVVRSPIDGVIHTYVLDLNDPYKRIYNPSSEIGDYQCNGVPINRIKNARAYLADYLVESAAVKFKEEEVNFCINSADAYAYNGRRRNVRVLKGGTNSSAVVLVELDDEGDNKCE